MASPAPADRPWQLLGPSVTNEDRLRSKERKLYSRILSPTSYLFYLLPTHMHSHILSIQTLSTLAPFGLPTCLRSQDPIVRRRRRRFDQLPPGAAVSGAFHRGSRGTYSFSWLERTMGRRWFLPSKSRRYIVGDNTLTILYGPSNFSNILALRPFSAFDNSSVHDLEVPLL